MGKNVSGVQLHAGVQKDTHRRKFTQRTRGISIEQMVEQLSGYLNGWKGYFGYCETPSVLNKFDSWIRRRLRSFQWKQGKRGKRRFAELMKQRIRGNPAAQNAGSSCGPWRISSSPALHMALSKSYFASLGLPPWEAHRAE
jgi:RNA-directed DNA polymerase